MADQDVQNLSQFILSETPDGYLIEIEGDDGGKLALATTPDQLDAIIEALDDLLSEDDSLDEVDEDEDEDETGDGEEDEAKSA